MKNELKKELSKLSGIDFFSPKYREVFKKYFPEEEDAEEKRFEEVAGEPLEEKVEEPIESVEEVKGIEEEPKEVEEEKVEEPVEDKEEVAEAVAEEPVEEKVEEPAPVEAPEVEDKVEDIEKAEDEREIDKIEEEKAEDSSVEEEKHEEVNEESEEIGKDVDELKDELFDAKLELELVKGGVREDKLEPAKDYLKYKLSGVEDLEQVKDVLKEFPEWTKRESHNVGGFGMAVKEIGDNLTAEERRLKQLGIEPR